MARIRRAVFLQYSVAMAASMVIAQSARALGASKNSLHAVAAGGPPRRRCRRRRTPPQCQTPSATGR
eukprot:358940-Chlamydomonas_euryale.AAC.2